MSEQSKEKQANEQAKAQNLSLNGEKMKNFIVTMIKRIKINN